MTISAQALPAETDTIGTPEHASLSSSKATEVAVVMDFVGATLPQLDHLLDRLQLGSGASGLPGSLFQWSRATPDGVRVTEVWRSSGHFERYGRHAITPHLAEAGLPDPEITTYDVHSFLTRGASG